MIHAELVPLTELLDPEIDDFADKINEITRDPLVTRYLQAAYLPPVVSCYNDASLEPKSAWRQARDDMRGGSYDAYAVMAVNNGQQAVIGECIGSAMLRPDVSLYNQKRNPVLAIARLSVVSQIVPDAGINAVAWVDPRRGNYVAETVAAQAALRAHAEHETDLWRVTPANTGISGWESIMKKSGYAPDDAPGYYGYEEDKRTNLPLGVLFRDRANA